jgi:hypothetical protein
VAGVSASNSTRLLIPSFFNTQQAPFCLGNAAKIQGGGAMRQPHGACVPVRDDAQRWGNGRTTVTNGCLDRRDLQ